MPDNNRWNQGLLANCGQALDFHLAAGPNQTDRQSTSYFRSSSSLNYEKGAWVPTYTGLKGKTDDSLHRHMD